MEAAKEIEFSKQRTKDEEEFSPINLGDHPPPFARKILSRTSTIDDLTVDMPAKGLIHMPSGQEQKNSTTNIVQIDVELGSSEQLSNQNRNSRGIRSPQAKKLFNLNLVGFFLSLLVVGVGIFFCVNAGLGLNPNNPIGNLLPSPFKDPNNGTLSNGARLLQGGGGPQGPPTEGGPEGPDDGRNQGRNRNRGDGIDNSSAQNMSDDSDRGIRIAIIIVGGVFSGVGIIHSIIYLAGVIAIEKMSLKLMNYVHTGYVVLTVLSVLTVGVWWCIINRALITQSKNFLKELEELAT